MTENTIYLAGLNENNICTEVKTTMSLIEDGYVEIPTMDFNYYSWRKYDFETKTWSEEKYEPKSTAPLNEFEKLKQNTILLEQENLELKLALADLAELQDVKITELQMAIAELAEREV